MKKIILTFLSLCVLCSCSESVQNNSDNIHKDTNYKKVNVSNDYSNERKIIIIYNHGNNDTIFNAFDIQLLTNRYYGDRWNTLSKEETNILLFKLIDKNYKTKQCTLNANYMIY